MNEMAEPSETTNADAAPAGTDATQGTDLHRSKISPDDPRLRVERPRSRTLRRGPVLLVVAGVGAVVAIALVASLAGGPNDQSANKARQEPEISTPTVVPLPEVLRETPAPDDIASAPRARSDAGLAASAAPIDQGGDAARQASQEELLRATGAGVLAALDDTANVSQQTSSAPTRSGDPGRTVDPSIRASGPADQNRPPDPNLQERKNDFLARSGVSGAEYLEKGVSMPRSPYEVKAGTVIPTVLISGISSDLPGQIIAQVRENVFDTVTGNHLLVPQGSRLLAAYDSMVAWGQERVLVCWNRLIRPDGSSIALDCMPGVDLAGYAGFADEVDNHWWRIITGAVFSSVLAATAQRSQGDVTGLQPTVPQVWASNAAGQVNQSGQQITQKNLQIQPTITVRPGFSVNVLVTKDIVIAPYNQGGTNP